MEQSFEEVLSNYSGLLYSIIKQFYAHGSTLDDLWQEARIAAWDAYKNYDETKGQFGSFIGLVVRRRLMSYVTLSNRNKNKPLQGFSHLDLFIGTGAEPARKDIAEEVVDSIYLNDRLQQIKITDIERDCLKLWRDGYLYHEIGDILGINRKRVDNALQRCMKKLKEI